MIVYHPSSGLTTVVQHFGDYGKSSQDNQPLPTRDREPWRPFASRVDFEATELTLKGCLSKPLTEDLLALLNKVAKNDAGLSLSQQSGLEEVWKRAEKLHSKVATLKDCFHFVYPLTHFQFNRSIISATYKKEAHDFELYNCSLWD